MIASIKRWARALVLWREQTIEKSREDWKLVGTVTDRMEQTIVRSYREPLKTEGEGYYHLFESNKGRRRCEFADTFDGSNANVEKTLKTFKEYNTKIYPWLQGRYIEGIASYTDVDSLDISKKLSEN